MAFYGLSVFLETPEHLRKGRKRYIAISFAITCLSALIASVDMANEFQMLFQSTSPLHSARVVLDNADDWKPRLSSAVLGILVWIGDALLVSVYCLASQGCDSWTLFRRYIAAM